MRRYTGAEYEYDYRHIREMNEESTRQYCSSLLQRFALQRNVPHAAEQWIARTYIAVKYLLAASLMLSFAEYALTRNLRIVEPYLLYFALFNSSRALMLMIPEQAWNDGAILSDVTHTKVARHLKIKKADLPNVLTAIYNARHICIPVNRCTSACQSRAGESWDTDPTLAMTIDNRKFSAWRKLSYAYFFEGLVRYCLMNCLKANMLSGQAKCKSSRSVS
jgi:hypothetical protein